MVSKRKSPRRGHDGCDDCPGRWFGDWYPADWEFASLDGRCGLTYPKNLEIQTCYVRDGANRLRYTSGCEVSHALILSRGSPRKWKILGAIAGDGKLLLSTPVRFWPRERAPNPLINN